MKGDTKILLPASIGCFAISIALIYVNNWLGGIFFIGLGIFLAIIGRWLMAENLIRIIIEGKTTSSVQGAELRETIQEIAREKA